MFHYFSFWKYNTAATFIIIKKEDLYPGPKDSDFINFGFEEIGILEICWNIFTINYWIIFVFYLKNFSWWPPNSFYFHRFFNRIKYFYWSQGKTQNSYECKMAEVGTVGEYIENPIIILPCHLWEDKFISSDRLRDQNQYQ